MLLRVAGRHLLQNKSGEPIQLKVCATVYEDSSIKNRKVDRNWCLLEKIEKVYDPKSNFGSWCYLSWLHTVCWNLKLHSSCKTRPNNVLPSGTTRLGALLLLALLGLSWYQHARLRLPTGFLASRRSYALSSWDEFHPAQLICIF